MNQPVIIQSKILDVNCGENVKIVEPVNIYGCEIGDNTFIGPLLKFKKM